MMISDAAISAFTTLIVILDPIGLVPIFLSLTAKMTPAERRQTAAWAASIAAGVLIFFALLGDQLLRSLGISLAAFRIAGGLMLFYTAFEMVFETQRIRNIDSDEARRTTDAKAIAAFPLAIPLMAGPGAITACILLAGKARDGLGGQIELVAVITLACAASFLCFFAAESVNKLLGKTGKIVLTRLLGVLLAALAVQFIADGVAALADRET